MVVGWAKGAETPQNRRVVDFWPVSSGHGSYQYVRYGGRQFGAPKWGSVRAATMANVATIVIATANSTFFDIKLYKRKLTDSLFPCPSGRIKSAQAIRGTRQPAHHRDWAGQTTVFSSLE